MTTTETMLELHGPLISAELARLLSVTTGKSINTCSQQVARDKKICRITGFFQSGQSIIFLPKHVEEGKLYDIIWSEIKKFGHKYWFTVNAVAFHGGTISRDFLETYSSYPILPLKSHIPFQDVMMTFAKQEILVFNDDEYSFSPKMRFNGNNKLLGRTLELIKLTVLDNFKSQARNMGLISYDTGEIFGEYGKFRWGLKAVCPVAGLRTGSQFGFLLADIVIGRPTFKEDIEFFVTKLKYIQSFKNASRILPYLIVDNLDKQALKTLKENGVVIGFINELFGGKYAKVLNDLITILSNAAASLVANPDKYLELIVELKKYNKGLLNNIKGALFEYVVGHYHIFKGSSIDIGWEIFENNASHEMDIRATYGDRVVIAECKGRLSPVDLEFVEKWLTKKIPAFKKWFQKQELYKFKKLEFELWSFAGFTSDAQLRLNKYIQEVKVKNLTVLGPDEIKAATKTMNNKKLQDNLDNFFLKGKV